MKKILFAIAIVLTISFTANAQGRNDAFFNDWSSDNNDSWRTTTLAIVVPSSNSIGGIEGDPSGAPLGSGLLVLTALGAGYAVARKKRK